MKGGVWRRLRPNQTRKTLPPDRFTWRPGERVDGPPRRRAQEAVKDRNAKDVRLPDGY
jgi:hypothetical protein